MHVLVNVNSGNYKWLSLIIHDTAEVWELKKKNLESKKKTQVIVISDPSSTTWFHSNLTGGACH